MAAKPAAEGRSGVSNPKQTGFVQPDDGMTNQQEIGLKQRHKQPVKAIHTSRKSSARTFKGVESQIRGYEEVALCPPSNA